MWPAGTPGAAARSRPRRDPPVARPVQAIGPAATRKEGKIRMAMTNRARAMGADIKDLGTFLDRLRRGIGVRRLASGEWFPRLVESYLEYREEYRQRHGAPEVTDEERIARARSIVRRAGAGLAMTGAGSGAAFTAATVTTAETNGLAGVVAFPLAGTVVGAEMIMRSVVHLRMTCELAELYGVHLERRHVTDLLRLYSLALGAESETEHGDLGRRQVERLVTLDERQTGRSIGMRLLGESFVRNVIPFLGIATSAAENWLLTARIGKFVRSYVTHHRALHDVMTVVEHRCPECIDPLIRGVWFVFTADGHLSEPEAALLASLVASRPDEARRTLLESFVAEEGDWLGRLGELGDADTRGLMLHALEVAAAVDASVDSGEMDIVRRAAEALQRDFDPQAVDEMARQFDRAGVVEAPH
jgi:hypothetical protein